ncbi:hypothetical protein MRB53_022805 [Persea americana]|uniref:Uncharacterized protein n=1 Tax=Persea americana TaxID=3435 RepID=A0ACC2L7Y8_PERAE|nr:hypothetical protein MRB53_022805 [Persea americana]
MPPPHTGVALYEKAYKLLNEWGIETKLFSLTLDNASNNDRFGEILKVQLKLKNALLRNGDFLHFRCCALILNLIVQDELKEFDESIIKVRESIKYVRGSGARKLKFMECVAQVSLEGRKGLQGDVPTRWNSTYLMLEGALYYRLAIVHLQLSDCNYNHSGFLGLFYQVTCMFSGTTYPTVNLYFPQVFLIAHKLKDAMKNDDSFMRRMATQMNAKFDKYWLDFSLILAVAVILDPRYKLQFVDWAYKNIYGVDSYEFKRVKDILQSLFESYSENMSNIDPIATTTLLTPYGYHGSLSVQCKDVLFETHFRSSFSPSGFCVSYPIDADFSIYCALATMAEEEVTTAAAAAEAAEEEATIPIPSDDKIKVEDLETDEEQKPAISIPPPDETLAEQEEPNAISNGVESCIEKEEEKSGQLSDSPEAKRPRLEEETNGSAGDSSQQEETQKGEIPQTGDSQHSPAQNVLPTSEITEQGNLTTKIIQQPASEVPQQGDLPTDNIQEPVIQQGSLPSSEQPKLDLQTSRKIEIPNNKVAVLIGKAGDTIKFLQYNSGTRIQITRDADVDPNSSTRPVELIGKLENINKAEQMIKDVIAEADARGSPALVARGFGTAQTGAEQIQMKVPYEKVGWIIGKGGETIKNLQAKSGARIQVILQNIPEGDASNERTVRITGNKQQIETAREMIKEVVSQAVVNHLQANENVSGIGLWGRSMVVLTRKLKEWPCMLELISVVGLPSLGILAGGRRRWCSGRRALIDEDLSPKIWRNQDKRVSMQELCSSTGKAAIDDHSLLSFTEGECQALTLAIAGCLKLNSTRPSRLSGGFSQPAYRPRGPAGLPQRGPRVPPPSQPTSYGPQGGMYPSQTQQYPPQPYGGYPQQAPRSSFNPGWDQKPLAPTQIPSQSGAYDHYIQGRQLTDGPAQVAQSPMASAAAPNSAPAPGPFPTQTNYNYGQPQGYGQPTPYPQSVPPQQSYENQAPNQHAYGGHGGSQHGAYPQQVNPEPGYMQQPYSKPAYGMPSQGPPQQSYGPPPRANQPGDVPYQGSVPSAQTYGPQQSYPYAPSGPSQQSYPYGPTATTSDGYTQSTFVTAPTAGYAPQSGPVVPGYTQQGGQVAPGYAQQGGQVAPGYAQQGLPAPGYTQQSAQPAPVYAQQGGQSGGYGQYPSSQPGYGDQAASNNAYYGYYQGSTDAGYNSMPSQAYGASVSGQVGYVQPTPNQSSYEQPAPQSGYGGNAGMAPVGYAKSASPQPQPQPQPQPGYGQY